MCLDDCGSCVSGLRLPPAVLCVLTLVESLVVVVLAVQEMGVVSLLPGVQCDGGCLNSEGFPGRFGSAVSARGGAGVATEI